MREWNEPRRDEALASAPEVPAHRSRKNTRLWCKGKRGVPHDARIRIQRHAQSRIDAGADPNRFRCRWGVLFYGGEITAPRLSYRCYHEVACEGCGKILESYIGWDKCPAQHRGPDQDKLGELPCDRCGFRLDEHAGLINGGGCRYRYNGDPGLNALDRTDDDA